MFIKSYYSTLELSDLDGYPKILKSISRHISGGRLKSNTNNSGSP